MRTEPDGDTLLTPLAAAHHLGITTELLFQFTKRSFGRASGLRSLRTVECDGQTRFSMHELDAFDALLSGPWSSSPENRPNIPKAILDHLRAESQNQCARCASGIGVDTAHVRSWAESRSHHHHNLIRLCTGCHREHDAQHSLPTDELRAIKERLIAQTRARLTDRMHPPPQRLRPPRASRNFVGRESELATLIDALQSGRSAMISGAGGIGKSELLVQALSRCETGRTVFWCHIEQYRTVSDTISALRTAIGTEGIACSEAALPSRLDAIQACVVFDGIEQGSLDDLDNFEDAVSALFDATSNTQFISTTQIYLHRLPAETRLKLSGLDEPASRSLLYQSNGGGVAAGQGDIDPLLKFCDGHALTLRLAGALTEHYGSATGALNAIHQHGVQSVSLPGRRRQSRQTSLELCLETAYAAFPEGSRQLLWALAQAPAGILTHYIERQWLELDNIAESLASLRRWHFIDVIPIDDQHSRTRLLAPIRQFAVERGRREEPESFERIISRMVHGFGMMVAVFELKYDAPEDTPYVLQRYGDELPNLLYVLELAKERQNDGELVTTAVSIVRSLMRYFFVLRLPEQGSRVIHEAAELALRTSRLEDASGLAMQFMSLAQRAGDEGLIAAGVNIAGRIEAMTKDPELLADVAMCRAIAARETTDFPAAERHARHAFEGYRARLLALKGVTDTDGSLDFTREGLHNDLSSALGILGFALLSQGRYPDAAKVYRHSLQHVRGASIAVNRGQTLHQIGNCESHLGNYQAAAELYVEAAWIFHFVGMEEYLSNALGELGYALLDVDLPELLAKLDGDILDHGLVDLVTDTKRAFDLARPLDHQRCIGIIRKLFGTVILLSLGGYGSKLAEFCVELGNETVMVIGNQVGAGTRDREELFPLMMVDTALRVGVLVAQGEFEFEKDGDISNETVGEILRLVCNAHDWTQNIMRMVDWLSVYLTRRWRVQGADVERLRAFVKNFEDDVEDYLDLAR